MELQSYFPIWNKLTPEQQARIMAAADFIKVTPGTLLHDSDAECLGLLLIRSGQLRAYILSEEGRSDWVYCDKLIYQQLYRVQNHIYFDKYPP